MQFFQDFIFTQYHRHWYYVPCSSDFQKWKPCWILHLSLKMHIITDSVWDFISALPVLMWYRVYSLLVVNPQHSTCTSLYAFLFKCTLKSNRIGSLTWLKDSIMIKFSQIGNYCLEIMYRMLQVKDEPLTGTMNTLGPPHRLHSLVMFVRTSAARWMRLQIVGDTHLTENI